MFKDFSDVIYELNKEPIEKQLAEVKRMIIKLANLFEKLINYFNNELVTIQYKIISIEAKDMTTDLQDLKLENRSVGFDVSNPDVLPLPLQHRPNGKEDVRSALLKELKDMFKKIGYEKVAKKI